MRAGCALTAFEDSSFNGDQVEKCNFYSKNVYKPKADSMQWKIETRLRYKNCIFKIDLTQTKSSFMETRLRYQNITLNIYRTQIKSSFNRDQVEISKLYSKNL